MGGSGGALHLGLLAHDELVERCLRFRSAFCIFSRRSTGLTGGGVAYRRSRRDGESIEIRGDGLTLLVAAGRVFPVAAPKTSESPIGY